MLLVDNPGSFGSNVLQCPVEVYRIQLGESILLVFHPTSLHSMVKAERLAAYEASRYLEVVRRVLTVWKFAGESLELSPPFHLAPICQPHSTRRRTAYRGLLTV